MWPVVKVIGVEIINGHAITARTDKVVGVHLFIEIGLDGAHVLVREVFTDHPFAGFRVVRFADAREQHQAHVVELESAQNDQVCRLFDLTAQRVDVSDARGFALGAVQVDPNHMGVRAQLKVGQRLERGQNVHVWRGFGVHVADITTAETAEVARPHLCAIRVGIRP